MTFKTTVKDQNGVGIQGVLVIYNDEISGEAFMRSTDGNGYADCAMLGKTQVGDRVTRAVMDPAMRFVGQVDGDAFVVTADDQTVEVDLRPF